MFGILHLHLHPAEACPSRHTQFHAHAALESTLVSCSSCIGQFCIPACAIMVVALLSVNNISMRFGARTLFEDVTCTFLPGRRYAVTGPNGAGKSTLMKILTGDIEPTKGSITRPKKFGVLRQDQFAFDQFRVIDTVIMGNVPLWKALAERDILYAKPHDQLTDEDGMRLGELEGVVGEEGGYTAESDAAVLLDGLGVEDALHTRLMGELQGGQKVRVLLAQALFGAPPLLLLDE